MASRPLIKRLVLVGCAITVGALPGLVTAVGFGKIDIESALGEPLLLRVPLVSVQPGELDELDVSLADPNWYAFSGVEYPEIAGELILNLDLSDPAEPAVRVTTVNGVNQIAIPLVLELEWPQRVMRRQMNVLLNPVGYRAGTSSASASGSSGEPAEKASAGDDGSLVEASGTIGATTIPTTEETDSIATDISSRNDLASSNNRSSTASGSAVTAFADLTELSGAEATSLAQSETAGISATSRPGSDSANNTESVSLPDSVVVKGGDSLSTIVDRYLPDGATRFQGRMAVYDENPDAFLGGDINQLIQDVVIAIPSSRRILDTDADEARRLYADLVKAGQDTNATTDDVETTASATAADTSELPATGGFRLSLLEVDDPAVLEDAELASADNADNPSTDAPTSRAAQSGQIGDAPGEIVAAAQAADAGAGDIGAGDFAMQGFSMKLTVMNAYIVELQDENQQLKNRVATLEQKVEQLILRSQQPSGSLASGAGVDGAGTVAQGQEFVSEPSLVASDAVDQAPGSGMESTVVNNEIDLVEELIVPQDFAEPGAGANDDTRDALLVADSATTIEAGVGAEDVQTVTVIPDSANATNDSSNIVGAGVETTSPQLAYRQGLLERAKTFLTGINSPVTRLIAAVVALGIALLLWMVMKDRRRYRLADEFSGEDESLDYDESVGVRYTSNDEIAVLDLEDDPWVSQTEIPESELGNLHDSDVDLITQSEVYLTYNRPVQAVEVLQEEYGKTDADKFLVAARILKIFEAMGEHEERNQMLRNFIVTLNADIEEFSAGEWDALRHDLNALRRTEHLSAVDMAAGVEVQSMDEHRGDTVDKVRRFGTIEIAGDAGSGDVVVRENQSGASDEEETETQDDGVVELTYDRDKAQSR